MHALTQYIYLCELIIKKFKDKLIDAKVETLDTNLGLQSLVPIRGSVNLDVMRTEFKLILLMGNGAYIRLKSGKKVQFIKAALFGSKATMNIFEKYSNMTSMSEGRNFKNVIFSL